MQPCSRSDSAEKHKQEACLKMILISVILQRSFRGEQAADTIKPGQRHLGESGNHFQHPRRGLREGNGGARTGRRARLQSGELCDHNRHCPCWPHPLYLAVAARRRKQRVEVGSRRRSCWQFRKITNVHSWGTGRLGRRSSTANITAAPSPRNGNGSRCICCRSLFHSRSYSQILFFPF